MKPMILKNAAATVLGAAFLAAGLSACAQSPSAARSASTAGLLSAGEIEKRAVAEGLDVSEIELEGRLAEVEGFDAQSRRVELVIDRRSGEILTRKTKQREGKRLWD